MSDNLLKNLCILLNHVKSGKSVFITGSAGTGKTTLLKQFIQKYNKHNNVIVSASTGIAALHIENSTIHSLLKLNSGTTDQMPLLSMKYRSLIVMFLKKLVKYYQKLETI